MNNSPALSTFQGSTNQSPSLQKDWVGQKLKLYHDYCESNFEAIHKFQDQRDNLAYYYQHFPNEIYTRLFKFSVFQVVKCYQYKKALGKFLYPHILYRYSYEEYENALRNQYRLHAISIMKMYDIIVRKRN